MFSIDQIEYLWLMLLTPAIGIIYLIYFLWQKRARKRFGNESLLKKMSSGLSSFRPFIKVTLLAFAIAFLAIGLANPKLGTKLETVKRKGADIVFALDVSRSMLAEDVSPNRLKKAKFLIQKSIENLKGDRIGIIIYAGGAYPLLPITTDYSSAILKLNMAGPDLVPSGGTALDQALEQSQQFFNNENQKNRLLILLSDGEDHDSGWEQELGRAKEKGIKIVSVGIGSEKGAPIPIGESANNRGFIKDQDGDVVVSKLNKEVLMKLSQQTDGVYLDGSNTNEVLESLSDLIESLDKEEIESKEFTEYDDQFQWFLTIGLILLVIDILVVERKTNWMEKLGLIQNSES